MNTTQPIQIGRIIRDSARTLSGAGVDQAHLEAELLVGHVLGLTRAQLLSDTKQILSEAERKTFLELLDRRCRREPFQYLVGVQEFWGREFKVSPHVLIPRPETEHLIEAVRGLFPDTGFPLTGADIGTGSGCLAVTLAILYPRGTFLAVDRSAAALDVARENARRHGVDTRIHFLEGDLAAPLLSRKTSGVGLDVIVSNPPYIPSEQMGDLQPEVGLYEPGIALDGGPSGLELYPRIFSETLGCIRPGGYLCLEMGKDQYEAVAGMATRSGFYETGLIHDLQGIPRTLILRKTSSK